MKKLMMSITVVALAAAVAVAAPTKKQRAGAAASSDEEGRQPGAKILVEQPPRTGQSSCLGIQGIDGASMIGKCYTKPRKWIVIETKYKTFDKFVDQLTFTWHVVLETKSAKENKGNRLGLPPYSYFNTTVSYFNIPEGSHAACVCLPPSYLEL